MPFLSSFKLHIHKFLSVTKKYKQQRARYRYSLVDVTWHNQNELIVLSVAIRGIKNHIVKFIPDKILYDDDLLSEFSPCDVRAITYLSFRKHLKYENTLKISSQSIRNGETIFELISLIDNKCIRISANKLYQSHELLSCLKQADMINVISTAVQEQTIKDFRIMERL
jgi:hypothetical protein